MTLRISIPLAFLAIATSTGVIGCRKGNPGRVEAEAISQCEQGVRKASQLQDLAAASKVYYEACAGIHAEPKCQEAWKKAATAPHDAQIEIVIKGCAAAYCPILGESKFEACRKDFKPTPSTVQRAWPALQGAILSHDTGPYQARVQASLLGFYVHAAKLAGAAAPPASASAAASTAPASADGATTAAPPASASGAAPSASASAAGAETAKPEAKKPEGKEATPKPAQKAPAATAKPEAAKPKTTAAKPEAAKPKTEPAKAEAAKTKATAPASQTK